MSKHRKHKKKSHSKGHKKHPPTKKFKQKDSRDRNKRYEHKERCKLTHYRGIIKITPNATGFVKIDDFDEDIVIERNFLNQALHNDEVEICLHPQVQGERQTGEVRKIIKRFKTTFVGTIEKQRGKSHFAFLIPDDKRMYEDIFIPKPGKLAKDGYKVLVELTNWRAGKRNPEGRIIKVIGKKGDIDAEMHSIVYEKNLWIDFPKQVEEEANQIKKNARRMFRVEEKTRKDMRGVRTFTIDPFDAKDFDDALSFRWLNKDEFELGVHIADVTAYVKPGSPIDEEAQKRAFTIYLVDRTIPMLPEVLSNDLCSLNPHQDKLAFSAILQMNKKGQVKNTWFGRTIIHSDRRFVYEDAQRIIDARQGEMCDELCTLNNVAKKLRQQRMDRGAIDFDKPEVEFRLNRTGHPVEVHVKERLDTHKLIEEFMILANNEVAKYLSAPKKGTGKEKSEYEAIYRIHDKPKPESAAEALSVIRDLGYKVKLQGGTIPAKSMNMLLHEVEGQPEEALVNTLMIRSMAKAIYSTENIGHYGLALSHYAHFTSPIRRYADVTVHHVLDQKINNKKQTKQDIQELNELADYISQTEIQVQEAEFDSIELKQTEYMLDFIGQIFEGTITGIKKFGMFVQALETQAEGLIHISELDDDYYELDKNMHALVGQRTHKRYAIGDTVKIKVLGGDIDQRNINYALVEEH